MQHGLIDRSALLMAGSRWDEHVCFFKLDSEGGPGGWGGDRGRPFAPAGFVVASVRRPASRSAAGGAGFLVDAEVAVACVAQVEELVRIERAEVVEVLQQGVFQRAGGLGRVVVGAAEGLGGDAAVRITACTALWMAGVTNVGLYAMTMVMSPLVAVGIVFIRGDLRADDGPPITLRQVTPNLGWLLVGSFMSAALVNAGPLGVDVLASSVEAAKVTAFGNGVILARIPLFMFQAIQAALLPRLARLVAEGKFDEFRHSFNRLMTAVGGLAVTGAVATYFFGPKVLDIVYGGGLNGRTLGLLAVSSGLYMLAQSCAQAVIALHGHRQVAIGWLASAATFVAVTATVSDDLYLRVELGLVAGCAVAFAYFLVAMRSRIASGETVDVQSLVEGVLDSPFER